MISFTIQWQLLYILGPGKTLTLCWNPPMACSPPQCPWIQCIFSQEGLSGKKFGKLVTENRIRYLQKPLFNSVIVRTLESRYIVGTSLVIPTGLQLPTRLGFLLAPEGPSQLTHTFLASLPRMRWDPLEVQPDWVLLLLSAHGRWLPLRGLLVRMYYPSPTTDCSPQFVDPSLLSFSLQNYLPLPALCHSYFGPRYIVLEAENSLNLLSLSATSGLVLGTW